MLHFEAADQDAVDAAQVQIEEKKAAAKAVQRAAAKAKAERKAEKVAAVAEAQVPPRPELRLDNWALTYENPIVRS